MSAPSMNDEDDDEGQTPETELEKQKKLDAINKKKDELKKLSRDELAKRFALLKSSKEHFETLAKAIAGDLALIGEAFFVNSMEADAGKIVLSSELFSDGRERSIEPDLKYAPTIKDQNQFFAWLRATGNAELIKEYVHPATLTSFVTKKKEKNESLPTSLAIFEIKTALLKKTRKKTTSATKKL